MIGKLQGMEYKGVIESQEGICQNLKKKGEFPKRLNTKNRQLLEIICFSLKKTDKEEEQKSEQRNACFYATL